MTDKLLTMEEAAERLRTTPRHVRRLVFERRIAYRKVGRFVRFHPDDLAEYVAAHRVEAARPASGRLRAWAHMLGFGGHWSTKSRRYSTTMGALCRARVAFAKRRRARDGIPLDAFGRPEDDQAVIVIASWVFVGAGYETEGERWLALSAAARAREQRQVALEELRTMAA